MKIRKTVAIIVSISATSFLLILFGVKLLLRPQNMPMSPTAILQDFAGEYYQGDGLGANFLLSIKINNTFSFQAFTDMDRKWEYSGTTIITVEQIQLISPERALWESHELIPVKWGDRRYLVAIDAISIFCQFVDEGWEPRSWRSGLFYLRMNGRSPSKGRRLYHKAI